MDTVTQLLLGAAVGETIAGKEDGRRAAGWGAVCGTLPDLDVFIPLGNVVADFTYHRGYSHSLFVLTLATPVMWWLISRIDKKVRAGPRRWLLLIWLALVTHPILDAFTVYGTQLFLPFSNYPVSGSSIFIIDPLFTIPLFVGLLFAMISRNRGYRAAVTGLAIATTYLALSMAAKVSVERAVDTALDGQSVNDSTVLTTPGPFNIVLWRIVVMDKDGYREGFYSLFSPAAGVTFERYESDPALLNGIEDTWEVRRLKWFTHGFYSVRQREDNVLITDLRMGLDPDYVFSFVVGKRNADVTEPAGPVLLPPPDFAQRLEQILYESGGP